MTTPDHLPAWRKLREEWRWLDTDEKVRRCERIIETYTDENHNQIDKIKEQIKRYENKT